MKRSTLVILLVAAIVAIGGVAYFAQRNTQPLDKTVVTPAASPTASPQVAGTDKPTNSTAMPKSTIIVKLCCSQDENVTF